MRLRVLLLAFLFALGVLLASCGKERVSNEPFVVSYELLDGSGGPRLSLFIEGPEVRSWRVSLGSGGRRYVFSAFTGRTTVIDIPSSLLDSVSGISCLCLEVFDANDGTVLFQDDISIARELPVVPDEVRPCIGSVVALLSDGRALSPGDGPLSFTEGERGAFIVRPEFWNGNLVLNAFSAPGTGRMTLGSDGDVKRENEAFLVPFSAEGAGSGSIAFSISLNGVESDAVSIEWTVSPDGLYIADVRVISPSFDGYSVGNGGRITFAEGQSGSFVVRPCVWDENISLRVQVSSEDGHVVLCDGEEIIRMNNCFIVSFEARSSGTGKVEMAFCIKDGESSPFSFMIEVIGDEEEPVPPVRDSIDIRTVTMVSSSYDGRVLSDGERLSLAESETGIIVIRPETWDDNLILGIVPVSGSALVFGRISEQRSEGLFTVPFSVDGPGSGEVELSLWLKGVQSRVFRFAWEAAEAEPEVPSRDSVSISRVRIVSSSYDGLVIRDGERLSFPEGEEGTLVVMPGTWDDNLQLSVRQTAGGLAFGPVGSLRDEGVFSVPFRADAPGTGGVEVTLSLDGCEPGMFGFSWEVVAHEEEEPVRDSLLIESVQVVSASYDGVFLKAGDGVSVPVSESGAFIVKPNLWDDGILLASRCTSSDGAMSLGSGDAVTRGNGAFIVPFVAEKAGTGKVEFTVERDGESSEAFVVTWEVTEPEEETPPAPVRTPSVSLSVPPLAFVDREATAFVTLSDVEVGSAFSLTLVVDGKAAFTSTRSYEGLPAPVVLGKDVKLSAGWHTLAAECLFDGIEGTFACEPVRVHISKPVFKWFSEDGTQCRETLDYGMASECKRLSVSLDCDDSLINRMTLVEVSANESYTPVISGGWNFYVGHRGRGERSFSLVVDTNVGSFSWAIQAVCRDVWTIEPYINGKTLYGRFTGPENSLPCSMELSMKLLLCAYIPYEEAVIRYGEHVVESCGEYVDIGYEEESMQFAAGTSAGNHVLWSGNISTGLSYGKKQAAKASVRKNGSSRWVNRGGEWTVEYYTPTPVPHLDLYVMGKIAAGAQGRYLSFNMKYDSMTSWLKAEGYSFGHKEYWEIK